MVDGGGGGVPNPHATQTCTRCTTRLLIPVPVYTHTHICRLDAQHVHFVEQLGGPSARAAALTMGMSSEEFEAVVTDDSPTRPLYIVYPAERFTGAKNERIILRAFQAQARFCPATIAARLYRSYVFVIDELHASITYKSFRPDYSNCRVLDAVCPRHHMVLFIHSPSTDHCVAAPLPQFFFKFIRNK